MLNNITVRYTSPSYTYVVEPPGTLETLSDIVKVPCFRYRSKRTGLTLTLLQPEGPIVDGYFCLTTEAWDDDGIPHVL